MRISVAERLGLAETQEIDLKACIVTTTKTAETNLGDKLIADRCGEMVRHLTDNVTVREMYHGHKWEVAKDEMLSSDVVVIACLAIRRQIFTKSYRFIEGLIASDIPICIVASGVSLGAFSSNKPLQKLLGNEEVQLLRALAKRSAFFSTRGLVTQSILDEMNVPCTFAGDVAFFEPRFTDRKFEPMERVRRVAISDPHYAPLYRDSFLHLVKRIKSLFPQARIDILVHGVNDEFMPIAREAGVDIFKLYDKYGLDHYDRYDLHVGYRVHGHVSALSRRKPSYLIEQDDRGTDYGTKFSRRITVASHGNMQLRNQILLGPVETIVATIRQDAKDGFSRFAGLEVEVEACGQRNFNGVKDALVQAGVINEPA